MGARRKGEEQGTSVTGAKHFHAWAWSCVVGKARLSSGIGLQEATTWKHKTLRRRKIQRREAEVLSVLGSSNAAPKHDDAPGEMVISQRHAEASHSLET
jgi:hypothetical protein